MTLQTVQTLAQRLTVEPNPLRAELNEAIRAAYRNGVPAIKLAEAAKLSRARIYQILEEK